MVFDFIQFDASSVRNNALSLSFECIVEGWFRLTDTRNWRTVWSRLMKRDSLCCLHASAIWLEMLMNIVSIGSTVYNVDCRTGGSVGRAPVWRSEGKQRTSQIIKIGRNPCHRTLSLTDLES